MTTMVDDEVRRAALVRHWQHGAEPDQVIAHEIYHDDAVLEFPQSGERFEGVENFRQWRRQYPANLAFRTRRISGSGDVWVAENLISYDGGPWMPTVSVLEFRGDRVVRERIYITERGEPAPWRSTTIAD